MSSFDLVIRGGRWFDGTGAPSAVRDIGVRDGRVSAISEAPLPTDDADVVEAGGKWVTPGFVDIHTHYDAELLAAPGLTESVRHGVTTVVTGSCSLSTVFSSPLDCADLFSRVEALPRDPLLSVLEREKTWDTPAGWVDRLERAPLGPNVASMIGHSDLRAHVMGLGPSVDPSHRPSRRERQRMIALLDEALDAGFVGMSTMTNPWDKLDGDRHRSSALPSTYATWREYGWLHDVLRKRGRILQSAPNLNTKVNLFLFFLSSMRLPWRDTLKTTLISAADPKASPWLASVLGPVTGLLNRVLRADVRWQTLPVPFEIFADGMELVVFEEFGAGQAALHLRDELERNTLLRTESYRRAFRRDYEKKFSPRVWHRDFYDATIVAAPDESVVGRSFGDVADSRGCHPADVFLDLVVAHGSALRWKTLIANHRPDVLAKLATDPNMQIGFADSGAHLRNMGFYNFPLHMLKMATDAHADGRPFSSMEKTVARLTGDLASWFGIDAGRLRVGDRADIAVVDPTALDGIANYHEARLEEMGGVRRIVRRNDEALEAVVIGGRVACRRGRFASDFGKTRPYGKFLRAGNEPTNADDDDRQKNTAATTGEHDREVAGRHHRRARSGGLSQDEHRTNL